MPKNERPLFVLSLDAKALYERLIQSKIGDVIYYKELGDIVDRSVQKSARGVLQTARKRARNEDQIVFGVVQNVGLKRLDDAEIVTSTQSDMEHIRRTARKAARIITCANYDKLDDDLKVQHNAKLSTLGALAVFTNPRVTKRIHAEVAKTGKSLSLAHTVAQFVDGLRAQEQQQAPALTS